MNAILTISIINGNVQVSGPLLDVPLCMDLLSEAQHALAKMMRENERQQAQSRQLLFMPDGFVVTPSVS